MGGGSCRSIDMIMEIMDILNRIDLIEYSNISNSSNNSSLTVVISFPVIMSLSFHYHVIIIVKFCRFVGLNRA